MGLQTMKTVWSGAMLDPTVEAFLNIHHIVYVDSELQVVEIQFLQVVILLCM